jgi:hypothetical protein
MNADALEYVQRMTMVYLCKLWALSDTDTVVFNREDTQIYPTVDQQAMIVGVGTLYPMTNPPPETEAPTYSFTISSSRNDWIIKQVFTPHWIRVADALAMDIAAGVTGQLYIDNDEWCPHVGNWYYPYRVSLDEF